MGITPNPQKSFLSCTHIMLKPEKRFACVTGLRFVLAHVILVLLSGMSSINEIGCKIVHESGKRLLIMDWE